MNKYEQLIELFDKASKTNVQAFNKYCRVAHNPCYIYDMQSAEKIFDLSALTDKQRKCRWFQISKLGNPRCFNTIVVGRHLYVEDMIDYILRYNEDFGDLRIRDILMKKE